MYFFILFFFHVGNSAMIYQKLPEVDGNFLPTDHLKFNHIKKLCAHRYTICESNMKHVCALRLVNGREEYKDFSNACLLFFNNMCEFPGQEYNIVDAGFCGQYLRARRYASNMSDTVEVPEGSEANTEDTGTVPDDTSTVPGDTDTVPENTGSVTDTNGIPILRVGSSTLFSVDSSFDYHPCPISCPDEYKPICLTVNKTFGKYLKFMTFSNHCRGDLYYCLHPEEFDPPPFKETEEVRVSYLGYAFCGAHRYMQFARFSEAASSMGHYGWLAGDYKYSRILTAKQRAELIG